MKKNEILFNREKLKKVLSVMSKAIGAPRDGIHTQCVKLEWMANSSLVNIQSTNLIVDINMEIDLELPQPEDGKMLIQHKPLNAIVSNSSSDAVKIVLLEEVIKDSNGQDRTVHTLEAIAGNFQHHFQYIDPEDFPRIGYDANQMGGVAPSSFLGTMQEAIVFATGEDNASHHLQGVHLRSLNGMLHAEALDGHRMAVMAIQTDCDVKAIVHKKGMEVLAEASKQGFFDDIISIGVQSGKIWFASKPTIAIGCRIIDGAFPDMSRWLVRKGEAALISKGELQKTVKLLYDLGAEWIKVGYKDQQLVVSSDTSVNYIPISTPVVNSAEPTTLNIDYVIKAIAAAPDASFEINIADKKTPVHLSSTVFSWETLLMPITVEK